MKCHVVRLRDRPDLAANAIRLGYESSHDALLERLSQIIEAPEASQQLVIAYLSMGAGTRTTAVVIENSAGWFGDHPYAALNFLIHFETSAVEYGERDMWLLLDV